MEDVEGVYGLGILNWVRKEADRHFFVEQFVSPDLKYPGL
jgi:hypothetical protein